jgi:hypothetical protein
MRCVLHAHHDADLKGFVNPLQDTLARNLQGAGDLAHGLAGMVTPQDLRPLDIAEGSRLGLAKLIEMFLLFVGQNELRTCGCSCHARA